MLFLRVHITVIHPYQKEEEKISLFTMKMIANITQTNKQVPRTLKKIQLHYIIVWFLLEKETFLKNYSKDTFGSWIYILYIREKKQSECIIEKGAQEKLHNQKGSEFTF